MKKTLLSLVLLTTVYGASTDGLIADKKMLVIKHSKDASHRVVVQKNYVTIYKKIYAAKRLEQARINDIRELMATLDNRPKIASLEKEKSTKIVKKEHINKKKIAQAARPCKKVQQKKPIFKIAKQKELQLYKHLRDIEKSYEAQDTFERELDALLEANDFIVFSD